MNRKPAPIPYRRYNNVCEICGKKFIAKVKTQRACPGPCLVTSQKESARRSKARFLARHPGYGKTLRSPEPALSSK